jgi:hypothetical protein
MIFNHFCRIFLVTIHVLEFEKLKRLMCNVNDMIDFVIRLLADQLFAALRTKFTVRIRGDVFKWWATTIVIFSSGNALAASKFDYWIGGQVRSFPLAGVIEGESGYNSLVWGDVASPFHGYVRPRLYGSSAGTYNSLDGALEFFPLAILGARAGGEAIQNDKNYTDHNCVLYACRGRFYRSYVEAELSLGAGDFFAQARWRRERWTQGQHQPDFVDPTSGIAMQSDGDVQTVYFGILGYKFSSEWSGLAVTRYAEGTNLQKFSRFPYLIVKYQAGSFSIGAGGGFFQSSDHAQETSLVGFFKWEIEPSFAIR